MEWGLSEPVLQPCLPSLSALWPGTGSPTIPFLSFHTCKMGMVTTSVRRELSIKHYLPAPFLPIPIGQEDFIPSASCHLHDKTNRLIFSFPNIKIYHKIEQAFSDPRVYLVHPRSTTLAPLSIHRAQVWPPVKRVLDHSFLLFHLFPAEEELAVSSCKAEMETGKSASKGLRFPNSCSCLVPWAIFKPPLSETPVLAMDLFS